MCARANATRALGDVAFPRATNYLLAVTTSESPARWPLLPGALLFALLAWKLNFLCDDAFISFRYSRNLAEGFGLRYNLAPDVPVEGYSNFLWVIWIALFEKLGLDPGVVARLSSAACGLALVLWVPLHARKRLQLGPLGTAAVGAFLGTLPAFALWATGGLATMPAALLLFGVYERLLGDEEVPHGLGAAGFAALAALLRADGVIGVGLLLAAAALLWCCQGRSPALRKALVQVVLVLIAVVTTHVLWRHGYYEQWVPNTARIKVGLSAFRLTRGFNYVMTWFLSMPATLVVLIAALPLLRRGPRALVWPAWIVIGGTLAYSVWVGGDFMPFGRFLLAATPFLALLLAVLWKQGEARGPLAPPLAAGLTAICLLANVLVCFGTDLVPESIRSHFHFRLNSEAWQSELSMRSSMQSRTEEWTRLGRALALCTEPEQSMILAGIGAIGYHSRLEIMDRYGLVSPEVLESATPQEKASPGHDIEVPTTFFYDQKPSIGGAFFAGVNAPASYNLPPGWEQHPISKMMKIERHPLPDGQDFTPGTELRLLRFVRWPEGAGE